MKTYAVKEVFQTLQGEGYHTGRAATFVRFAGCNLWNGREPRTGGSCSAWCDTDFVGGEKLTVYDILERVKPGFVVLTGGEPLLQVDAALTSALRQHNCFVAVETNGTQELPRGLDWVTVSPKAGHPPICGRADEVKLVWPQPLDPESFLRLAPRHYLQPMAGREGSTQACIDYCLLFPAWKLSLQTHKLVGLR